ncbi:XtrA/YqaO family protein [Bacillus halotolerans]|uniref:XtrA/YqaO family protein n=1 Tax=Bacillus halotolerans TaxID=260554 RepID=UPI002DBD44B3|nr:XtrA/YqaO family protein [Bacillus halotolerans]MEC1662984.1 XtrA/YqaO family protein [Bacillus halotolerans]
MNKPQEIKNRDLSIGESIEPGKIRIIILDGNEGTAHVLEAPEHGKTIIQTAKGSFARVDHEIGFKIK